MRQLIWVVTLPCAFALCSLAQPGNLRIDWSKIVRESKTTPTLQVVVNPPLRRGSAIHDQAFAELKQLGADYVRYVPWLPYPKLGVAELEAPTKDKTFWDFSLIDPMTTDFLNATSGHSVILNFSIIPQWMFKTPQPIPYPKNPDEPTWKYQQGTELRDPSMKELGDYYARLVSWYTQGGFMDELGKRHESGHHFHIEYWEVLNEADFEHDTTPEQYTARYDAIVQAIRKVAPNMKFVALALAAPSVNPRMFEYFLDRKNHKPGIPIDMISYHFYATPGADETPEIQQFTFFRQADHFIDTVRFIDAIRQRLSPSTRTTIDEIGSISADDGKQGEPGHVTKPIPNSYWNLSGAMYAYLFGRLSSLGIDVAGESQLVGYPTQYPSVSLVDWNTGKGNARFRVLELLKNHFGPGDKIAQASLKNPSVYAQAYQTRNGKREVLLVNMRNHPVEITLGVSGATVDYVSQGTASSHPAVKRLPSARLALTGLEVAVVTFP